MYCWHPEGIRRADLPPETPPFVRREYKRTVYLGLVFGSSLLRVIVKPYKIDRNYCMMIYSKNDIDEYIIGMAHFSRGKFSPMFIDLYNQLMAERKYKEWIDEKDKAYKEVTDNQDNLDAIFSAYNDEKKKK